MSASGDLLRLHPRDIKFTQDSIKDQFRNGDDLADTLSDLLYRKKTVDDIPPIEVVEDVDDHGFWALTGNRRLYLYRRLEQLGVIETIPVVQRRKSEHGVSERLNRRRTTLCGGRDIRLRGNEGVLRMNMIIEEWRRLKSPTASSSEVIIANPIHGNSAWQRPTPKKVLVESLKEVPLEQYTSNRGTAGTDEGVTYFTDKHRLLEHGEQTAITNQPQKESSSYVTVALEDNDDGCCCCSFLQWYCSLWCSEENENRNFDM